MLSFFAGPLATIAIISNIAIPAEPSETSNPPILNTILTSVNDSPDLNGSDSIASNLAKLRPAGSITPYAKVMTPHTDGGSGLHYIPNYPRVSRQTGCAKAQHGQMIFSIAWSGLVCIPFGIGTGGFGSFACGVVGSAITTYLPWNNICR